MTTYTEKYDEQHVRGGVLYGKTADHKLYTNSAMTIEATTEEVENLYKKNMLVIVEGTVTRKAVNMTENKVYTLATQSDAVVLVEWTAKVAD